MPFIPRHRDSLKQPSLLSRYTKQIVRCPLFVPSSAVTEPPIFARHMDS